VEHGVEALIREGSMQLPSPTSSEPFWLDEGGQIFVYGTGTVGRDVWRVLTARGIPVAGFMDHLRHEVPSLNQVPLFRPDDTRLTAEVRGRAVVILAIHNYEVDMAALIGRLSGLGYPRTVSMIDLYDHFAEELGTRYWLTRRTFYQSRAPVIGSAYNLLADETSRSLFSAILGFRIAGDYSSLPEPDREHQYAPADIPGWIIPLRLVDCGAYDGDTLKSFLEAGTAIEALAAFEPDPDNFARLSQFVRETRQSIGEAYLWPCAVHSFTGQLRFDGGRGEASAVASGGDALVPSVALDDVLHGFSPNLIKLDIEGAEHEALLGARQMIAAERPGLAVCLYHRPEHLWEIPLLIEKLAREGAPGPEYRYYLRAHAYSGFELVLYAVPLSLRNP